MEIIYCYYPKRKKIFDIKTRGERNVLSLSYGIIKVNVNMHNKEINGFW